MSNQAEQIKAKQFTEDRDRFILEAIKDSIIGKTLDDGGTVVAAAVFKVEQSSGCTYSLLLKMQELFGPGIEIEIGLM